MYLDQSGPLWAQVSKAWNILALDGSNWQNVDLFEFQVDIEGVVVENLAKRCGVFLRTFSLASGGRNARIVLELDQQ